MKDTRADHDPGKHREMEAGESAGVERKWCLYKMVEGGRTLRGGEGKARSGEKAGEGKR